MTARATCKRSHDLTLPGAVDEYTAGKFRCAECRRVMDKERKRKKAKVRCSRGHIYTKATTRVVERHGRQHRQCLICCKLNEGQLQKRQKESIELESFARTRMLLHCDTMRERESTWWGRKVWEQKKAALMRAQ